MPANRRSVTVLKFMGGSLRMDMPPLDTPPKVLNIQRGAENMRPALEEIGDLWLESVRRQFAAEGTPQRWTPLKPATIAEKRRRGYGGKKILVRTGRLKNGFSKITTPTTLRIQNRVRVNGYSLFLIHELGSRRRHIPARSMIQLTPRIGRDVGRVMRRHFGISS